MNAQEIVIVETTTCRLSPEVRLGVGNIWEEDDRGATAGLWVLPPRGAATQTMRVASGQQVAVPGYTITVLEVMLRGRTPRGALRLAVEPAAS
jgi:hypothetical protein